MRSVDREQLRSEDRAQLRSVHRSQLMSVDREQLAHRVLMELLKDNGEARHERTEWVVCISTHICEVREGGGERLQK